MKFKNPIQIKSLLQQNRAIIGDGYVNFGQSLISNSLLRYTSLVLIVGRLLLIHRASRVSRKGMLLVVDFVIVTNSLFSNTRERPHSLICFPKWSGRFKKFSKPYQVMTVSLSRLCGVSLAFENNECVTITQSTTRSIPFLETLKALSMDKRNSSDD